MSIRMSELISVLIIEDHPIYREAIQDHLETRSDKFHIVGNVAYQVEGLRLLKEHVPDIVLLDLGLPEKTEDGIDEGLELIQTIRKLSPLTRVVVLTAHTNTAVVFRAIQAGAVTYLVKKMTGQEVIESLLRVYANDPPVDPDIARKLYDFFQKPALLERSPVNELTPRELEVLELIADSLNNDEIAAKLVISPKTVKKHVSNILSKLELRKRVELMIYYRTGHLQQKTNSTP